MATLTETQIAAGLPAHATAFALVRVIDRVDGPQRIFHGFAHSLLGVGSSVRVMPLQRCVYHIQPLHLQSRLNSSSPAPYSSLTCLPSTRKSLLPSAPRESVSRQIDSRATPALLRHPGPVLNDLLSLCAKSVLSRHPSSTRAGVGSLSSRTEGHLIRTCEMNAQVLK